MARVQNVGGCAEKFQTHCTDQLHAASYKNSTLYPDIDTHHLPALCAVTTQHHLVVLIDMAFVICCVVVMFKSRGLGSGWFRAWSGSWSLVGLLWLIRVFPLTDILTLLRILQHLLLLCFSLFSFGSLGRNFLQRLPPQPKSFRIFIFLFTVCFSGCSFCS